MVNCFNYNSNIRHHSRQDVLHALSGFNRPNLLFTPAFPAPAYVHSRSPASFLRVDEDSKRQPEVTSGHSRYFPYRMNRSERRNMIHWEKQRQEVIDTARKMTGCGLVTGTSGNVSLRLPAEDGRELFAITPTSLDYDTLTAADIPIVDFQLNIIDGETAPSTEASLHAGIYRTRPDIGAIIHTHSVHASAVAVTGHDIPAILDDQVIFLGGPVRCARYGTTGSDELAGFVLEALGDRCAALLRNHGALGCGKNSGSALENCRLLEKTAQVYLLVLGCGGLTELGESALCTDSAMYRKIQFG